MGNQIIKQPNGRYAVFNSVVDTFTVYDATIEELIEDAANEYRESITEGYRKIAQQLDNGGKPYHQFTMTFDEAVKWARTVHRRDSETLAELREIVKAAKAQPADRAGAETEAT